jgi:protein gp37
VDPVYVTQTTIAVTILHKIHYSIRGSQQKNKNKNKTDYWFSKYNRFCDENDFIIFFLKSTGKCYAENDVTYAENDVTYAENKLRCISKRFEKVR